jgi:hypothetical protein
MRFGNSSNSQSGRRSSHQSYLIDAAELIGSQLLKKLEHNERLEDGDC